jgi:carboxyl-terminal processing protease
MIYLRRLTFILFFITPTLAFAQGDNDSYFEISKNLDVFASLFKELNESYVDPIEPGKVMKTGIDAMLYELDPYTNFISEDDIQDYRIRTTGEYGGIGSTVIEKDDYIVIDQPYKNSPTVKAGLKAGDVILAIDGKSIKGKSVSDVSSFLKGTPGSTVNLKVKDAYTGSESDKRVTRGKIKISSVPYAGMIGGSNDIAYARLTQFTMRCSNDLKKALDSLKRTHPNMKGVVLDLRSNPGGLLDEAIKVCNLFLPANQLVVSTKGKVARWDKDFKTTLPPWDADIPVAVLINNQSASASEIVAGTIQDLDRGVVLGQKSFGKGLVQSTKSLSFKSKLKVTTAKYYTPSGRCIQAIDYGSRKADGSVGEIPDSLKTMYKTASGREVWDGGGIEPDVETQKNKRSAILPVLVRKFYIFDYATAYAKKNPSIAGAGSFRLTDQDFTDFSNWLGDKDFGYKTKTEKALAKVKETAENEKYFSGIEEDYNKLMQALSHDKQQDLLKNKEQVMRYLQNEIVSRYYYREGALQNNLNIDTTVSKAIQTLKDGTAYQKVLQPK